MFQVFSVLLPDNPYMPDLLCMRQTVLKSSLHNKTAVQQTRTLHFCPDADSHSSPHKVLPEVRAVPDDSQKTQVLSSSARIQWLHLYWQTESLHR